MSLRHSLPCRKGPYSRQPSQTTMKSLLTITLLLATLSADALPAQRRTSTPPAAPFTVVEASTADLRAALEQKRTTSREIVLQYLTRLAEYQDKINEITTDNTKA